MPWPVTRSRVVYQNPWIRVVEDEVVRPDGAPGLYGVVELAHPAVFVVALSEADEIVFVEVDRHTVGRSLEIPSGGSDGQEALAAAQRELREETGLVAASWQQVGTMNSLNGVCRAPSVIFLATALSDAGIDATEQVAEGIAEVRRIGVAEVVEALRSGAITDNESVSAITYALAHLGRIGGPGPIATVEATGETL